jgi:quinol monooxygenase YgiN
VVIPEGEADRVLLYEIYDDAAAFEAHKQTAHFAVFDRDSAPLVAAKEVTLGDLVYAGSDR